MMERLFTAYQVADVLGRTRREVQQWIEAGELASQRLDDGTVRVSEKQLVRFLRAQGIDMEAIMADTLKTERQQTSPDERDMLLGPQAAEPTDESDLEGTCQPVPPLVTAEPAPPRMAMAAYVAAALDSEPEAGAESEGMSPVHLPPPSQTSTPTPPDASGHGPKVYASFSETVNGSPATPASPPDDAQPPAVILSRVPDASADEPTDEQAPPAELTADAPPAQHEPPAALESPIEADQPPQTDPAPTAVVEPPHAEASPAEAPTPAVATTEPPAGDEATVAEPPALPEPDEDDEPAEDPSQTDDEPEDQAPPAEPETSQAEQIARAILTDAISRGATAIRLDARGPDVTLRMRLRGAIEERTSFRRNLPHGMGTKLIDEFRAMAGLNGSVSVPQRGRGEIAIDGRAIELTVSGLPTLRGQEIVIRLADPAATKKGLAGIGISRKAARDIEALLARPYGMIVVASPPRHGLAETLGAMTAHLADSRRGVLAIQRGDGPDLANATQCRCGGREGMDWNAALWAADDHDCDVVAVEDIGDPDSAAATVESALAGRMVIGGMRAMSPVEAIRLLVRMGAKPWPLASSLIGVVTQRRLPTLCPHCRTPVRRAETQLASLNLTADDVDFETFAPAGCDNCNQTGYMGTALLTAVLLTAEALADAIRNGSDVDALNEALVDTETDTLLTAALRHVRQADLALADLVAAGIA